jgi:hypothetical protein
VGRPWPDGYRISDQGILNVALGFRDRSALERAYSRCLAAGHRGNWRPLELGVFTVVYVNDDQGFSVELLRCPRWAEPAVGFRPSRGEGPPARRQAESEAISAQPLGRPSGKHHAEVAVWIAAAREVVWERISDHERMPAPWPVKGITVVRAGEPERNGLGAVRLVRLPAFDFEEELVAWDPPAGYEYAITRGVPLGNHRGSVTLNERDGGTEVRWSVQFDPLVPGTGAATSMVLRYAFGRVLSSLKRALEPS